MHSPFPYDKLPQGLEFYGRSLELELLERATLHSNNVLIHSKRRMGKSSLIRHFLDTKKEAALCIYVDIFDITSKEDFAKALLSALSNATKGDLKSTIKKLTSLFKRVRVEPTIDSETLEYSLKPIVATLSFEEMMEDFFSSIRTLALREKVIIAIDEFQQIASITDVRLDAILRKEIQERGNNVSYVFAGSKRHLLTSLFEYKAPLYEMATHFELQALSFEEIHAYVTQHIEISEEILRYGCERCAFETKMLQNLFYLLWLQKELPMSREIVDEAIGEIINAKDASYRLLFDTLGNNQKSALKIVGKYKSGFFAQSVLNEYRIKKQTLQSSVDTLCKRELIDKDGEAYFIPDRTLELWVERL